MSKVNIPLLRKAVEWVEEQAEVPWQEREWDQRVWVKDQRTPQPSDNPSSEEIISVMAGGEYCGTTYCVAGYIANITGWTRVNSGIGFKKDDGESDIPSRIAAKELGINTVQAGDLFFAENDATRVREVAEWIAGEKL